MVAIFLLVLAFILGLLLWRDYGRKAQPKVDASRAEPPPRVPTFRRPAKVPEKGILVDGSNVMWWNGEEARIETLRAVIERLKTLGLAPAVVFDASAGHRLFGRYCDDDVLARALHLPESRVLVVPKGEVADRYLLQVARERDLPIVSNDRYRDWAEEFPESAARGRMVRGGWRAGKLWLSLDPR